VWSVTLYLPGMADASLDAGGVSGRHWIAVIRVA
jgi:hypothetical protein